MEIYFIRHGQTLWNIEKRFQGSLDSPLTPLGIEQAKKLSSRLNDIHFDKFFSSPLKRAADTANIIIGKRNQSLYYLDEFKEINMGDIEGKTREEFKDLYPHEFDMYFNDPQNYDPTKLHGESFEQISSRIQKGIDKLISNNSPNDRILVVSHGVSLKIAFTLISKGANQGTGHSDFVPDNTSVSIVEYNDDKFDIKLFSDISHLK